MMRRRLLLVMVGLSFGLAGCSGKPAPPAASPVIDWFGGTVDAAFAQAAATGKPVFLYWGATWCPPCHELKATVFSRPDFIAKLQLFVPVYIDGDAQGAQQWGDQFGVTGYPSVVVLRADRTELARINGGMDLALYADVLDLVLGDVQPVAQLLTSLGAAKAPLSRNDCRRLAYNGWVFDAAPAQLGAVATQLQRAAQQCPVDAAVERARLIVFATAATTAAEKTRIATGAAPSAQLKAQVQAVQTLLAGQVAALGAADALQILDGTFFKAARRALPDHGAQLLAGWSLVMDGAASDVRFAEADQLAAIGMKLRAIKELGDGKIAEATAAAARQRVEAALARGQSGYARAGVVNAALFVLDTLGDTDRVYVVAEAEMKTSAHAFYYMLDLASIEEDRGHKVEAVAWLERAYREAEGVATRFQWGTEYVLGLLRMQPQDEVRIRDTALAVLGELDGPDRIHRRTTLRLEKLDQQLRTWSAGGAHAAALLALRARRDALCVAIADADAARRSCEAFLGRR